MDEKNYNVKVSKAHETSQRSGRVITYVRFGKKIHSPIVQRGQADIILAFEELEAVSRFIGTNMKAFEKGREENLQRKKKVVFYERRGNNKFN